MAPIYRVLRSAEPGVVLELPMPAADRLPGNEASYLMWSTWHWHPLVNGYSGYYPPDYLRTLDRMRSFPDDAALDRLRALSVRYIVVHRDLMEQHAYSALMLRMATRPELKPWGQYQDPVGNASFMPWLVATALIHSLAVTEKRGNFRSWTVLLAILGFSLSLLGTFLVRSGVLTSVHAFATDPARGVFILIFLAIVVGGSLVLYAWRAPALAAGSGFSLVSRESMLLANNVLLVVAMAAVLLGTLYPLALDTLDMGKISVGPPYFDAVFYPLMAPALFLMTVGPIARWKQAPIPDIVKRLRWALGVAVIAAVLQPFTTHAGFRPLAAAGLALAAWIAAGVVIAMAGNLRDAEGRLRWGRARLHPASVWGMHLAHLGVEIGRAHV